MLIFQGACVLLNSDYVYIYISILYIYTWQKSVQTEPLNTQGKKNISLETETHPMLISSGCVYIAKNARGRNFNPAKMNNTEFGGK